MSIVHINSILPKGYLDILNRGLTNSNKEIHAQLGRVSYEGVHRYIQENNIQDILLKNINNLIEKPLHISSISCVEYSSLYGKPNLPPHLDGDKTEMIAVIQLESNTVWNVGLNFQVYEMKDNSALIFNPNKEVHWRTHKEFNDGEYVKMLFVRLFDPLMIINYTDISRNEMDYPDVCKFRDSYDATIHTL
jgi:hypothetical protein